MSAPGTAEVNKLRDGEFVRSLDLYQAYPTLIPAVEAKRLFWELRYLLQVHDSVNVPALLDWFDTETIEVNEAYAMWSSAGKPKTGPLVMNVRHEAADVGVFGISVRTFANGTWNVHRDHVMAAIDHAQELSLEVGGDLGQDTAKVIHTKVSDNYHPLYFDWGWILRNFPDITEKQIIEMYALAKKETRKLRDNHGVEGVLPSELAPALIHTLRTRDEKTLANLMNVPIIEAGTRTVLTIYDGIIQTLG